MKSSAIWHCKENLGPDTEGHQELELDSVKDLEDHLYRRIPARPVSWHAYDVCNTTSF